MIALASPAGVRPAAPLASTSRYQLGQLRLQCAADRRHPQRAERYEKTIKLAYPVDQPVVARHSTTLRSPGKLASGKKQVELCEARVFPSNYGATLAARTRKNSRSASLATLMIAGWPLPVTTAFSVQASNELSPVPVDSTL